MLDNETKNAFSLGEFKNRLPAKIRPLQNFIFHVHDIIGTQQLTKLRVKFSALNEHRFRHDLDCLSPIYSCGTANEDNEHFLLHCPF